MWKLFSDATPQIHKIEAIQARIDSLHTENQRLRDQLIALGAEKLLISNLLAAKEATIEQLNARLTYANWLAQQFKETADGHMKRVEKIMDYMTLTSTGKTIFAPEPAKPAEEAEVPEEQVKSVVDRLMNEPVEDNIMVQAVKAVGRRPRAIQKFVQKHRDDEAKQRVADQFDADRTDVAAAVDAELKATA